MLNFDTFIAMGVIAFLKPLEWSGDKFCLKATATPLNPNDPYYRVSYFVYEDGSFCVSTRGHEFQIGPVHSDIEEAKKAAEDYHIKTVLSLFKIDVDV